MQFRCISKTYEYIRVTEVHKAPYCVISQDDEKRVGEEAECMSLATAAVGQFSERKDGLS